MRSGFTESLDVGGIAVDAIDGNACFGNEGPEDGAERACAVDGNAWRRSLGYEVRVKDEERIDGERLWFLLLLETKIEIMKLRETCELFGFGGK
jgi:hypothetical protein